MKSPNIRRSLLIVATVLLLPTLPASAQVVLRVPDRQTAPFELWSRGDANSSYAHWDLFSSAIEPNSPDAGQYAAESATLVESTAGASGAFISGSGNIYSFAAPTAFDVRLPALDLGSGYQTQFVAQIVTLGTELDPTTIRLSYDAGEQGILPSQVTELSRTVLGGFGGDLVSTLYAWDTIPTSPAEFLLQLSASESSLSLDQVVIDAYTMTAVPCTPGDFDGDGLVNEADYTMWRSQFGTIGPQADGNGDGWVDAADYTLWRDSFTATGATVSSGSSNVPEPRGSQVVFCLLLTVAFCVGCDRWLARPSC